MMTIKVILAQTDQDERPTTHLFEGEKVSYKFIHFKDNDDFVKQYNEITGHLGNSYILGIPDYYWKSKEKVEANIFLRVYFGKKDELENSLILQNATVYVMQGGQTVDKIHC